MNDSNSIFIAVEDFLAEERSRLADDRDTIDFVLNVLQEDQQIFTSDDCHKLVDENGQVTRAQSEVHLKNGEKTVLRELQNRADENELTREKTICRCKYRKKLGRYNSQEEKERLAYLFETSQHFLSSHTTSRKYRYNENASNYISSAQRHKSYNLENKENQNLLCNDEDRVGKIQSLKCMASQPFKKTENVENARTMVRFGEYSPLHPDFSSANGSLIGLGEYEERRKLFLEKKKQEYLQYLKNAKKNRSLNLTANGEFENSGISEGYPHLDEPDTHIPSYTYRKLFTPNRDLINDFETSYTRLQQEHYRKDLDKQVEEKEKQKKERENLEKKECVKYECDSVKQDQNVMKHIEDEYNRRISALDARARQNQNEKANEDNTTPKYRNYVLNDNERSGNQKYAPSIAKESTRRSPFIKQQFESCAIGDTSAVNKMEKELYKRELAQQGEPRRIRERPDFEINTRTPANSRPPLMNQNAESCAIDDMVRYRKMQQEIYEKELDKQIEEKRILDQHSRLNHSNDTAANSRTPTYLRNPLMKQSAESCAIEDIEAFRRKQHELYKRELEKQIAEKRKLEEKQRAEAKEKERKLGEKMKKEAAKLREEYEKEEARRAYDAAQKMQIQKRVQDNLLKIKKGVIEKKDSIDVKFTSKPLKVSNVVPTDHKFNEKPAKNVSFAPRTFEYVGQDTDDSHCETNRGKSDAIIIEAPYVLAVKDVSNANVTNNSNCSLGRHRTEFTKPHSPILLDSIQPTFAKSTSEISCSSSIPTAVSMSRRATQQYFKSNTFSDLSRIRKMLKTHQSSTH